MATLSESLKRVIIKIRVGKVVKSVGLGIYKEIKMIKTAIAIEIVSIKSKRKLGRGTIIMAKIAITKKTILKSRVRTMNSNAGVSIPSS